MKMSDAHGRRVVSRQSAEEIGDLKHVVVDATSSRVTALHVTGRKKSGRVVDWDSVVGFGPDAIVVTGEDALRAPEGDHEQLAVAGKLDLIGRRVLSNAGDEIGMLTDVEFDEVSGSLQSLLVGESSHDASRLMAVGPYSLIVEVGEPDASAVSGVNVLVG